MTDVSLVATARGEGNNNDRLFANSPRSCVYFDVDGASRTSNGKIRNIGDVNSCSGDDKDNGSAACFAQKLCIFISPHFSIQTKRYIYVYSGP